MGRESGERNFKLCHASLLLLVLCDGQSESITLHSDNIPAAQREQGRWLHTKSPRKRAEREQESKIPRWNTCVYRGGHHMMCGCAQRVHLHTHSDWTYDGNVVGTWYTLTVPKIHPKSYSRVQIHDSLQHVYLHIQEICPELTACCYLSSTILNELRKIYIYQTNRAK